MLLLTSTTDQLQIVTSTAAAVDVHASWVDTQGTPVSTITPGRKNTNVITAATTSIVPPPSASVQRNVKTLHVRNKDAGLSCDVTIQHTDGTTVAQLYTATLIPGDMLMYTDQMGFGGGRIAPVTGSGLLPLVRVITVNGTYTPTPGLTYAIVECVGGGGGGGVSVGDGLLFAAGAGGAAGGYSRKLLTAAAIGSSQVVSIGAGGASQVSGSNTSFGSLVVARGGGAASSMTAGECPMSGAVGDIIARGGPGNCATRAAYGADAAVPSAGSGGNSVYGGGAVGAGFQGGQGSAGFNYGGGGAGANSAGSANGGAGGAGVCIVTEHFNL